MPENKAHDNDKRVDKKFMFDLRRFDEPEVEEVEDLPPTFSEEELAAARAQGYEEGKIEGHRLAVASREQLTANTLRSISESFTLLFVAEDDREKEYEEESVRLTQQILKKLFPVLNARFGHDEVQNVVLKVLQSRGKQSTITIEVSPEDAPGIEETLASNWSDPEAAPRYRVLASADIRPGQCRLGWEDGGAVRDASALAARINQALCDLLGVEAPVMGANVGESVPEAQNNAIKEEDSDESHSASPEADIDSPEKNDHE
jgi:flagellar assembly protein FliH